MKKKVEVEVPMIEHEANGAFVTKGLVEYIKGKILEDGLKIDHLKMTKSQWEKIVRMYEEVDGMKYNDLELAAILVKLDRTVPESAIWFCAKDGSVLGKIVGLER